MHTTYDPVIPPAGTYPREMKTCGYIKIFTQVFIATLFIIIIIWEQPECPSTSERINRMQYIHTMKYYSAIKKKKATGICNKMDEFQKHYAKRRKPDTKSNLLYDSIYMVF